MQVPGFAKTEMYEIWIWIVSCRPLGVLSGAVQELEYKRRRHLSLHIQWSLRLRWLVSTYASPQLKIGGGVLDGRLLKYFYDKSE